MQATQIKLGSDYAVHYKGQTVAFRAEEMVTTRTTRDTSNEVVGYLSDVKNEEGKTPKVKYAVADILGPLEAYRDLMAAKAKAKADAQAAADALEAKKQKAAILLANAIGVYAVPDRKGYSSRDADYRIKAEGPNVSAGYSNIDVNEKAIDYLIAYLEKQGVSPVDKGVEAMDEEEA